MSDYATINVATAEGQDQLARLAAERGPIFKVRHACDTTVDESAE